MHASSSSYPRRGLCLVPAALLLLVVEGCHPSTADATSAPSRPGAEGGAPLGASATGSATAAPTPDGTAPAASEPTAARATLCRPSSVSQGATCPRRVVPKGTGSSLGGCKSDADCKAGHDGRCVGNAGAVNAAPLRSNRFAPPPPPPPPLSVCVYDECLADTDCGAGKRCACRSGVGRDRNACVAADACLSDTDCTDPAPLCLCGDGGLANVCFPGNCQTDADCRESRECAGEYLGGRYCRTARDACRTDADCAPPGVGMGTSACAWDLARRARACLLIPPRPPG